MKPSGLELLENFVGRHPLLLSLLALSISFSIEVLQAWPAIFPFGHELGEVARNIGYGVAAAFAFNWIMIEVPRKREERRVLDTYWISLSTLASAGEVLLNYYQELAPEGEYDTQTWTGIRKLLESIPLIDAETGLPVSGQDAEKGIRCDPFAGSNVHKHAESAGRLISPFMHRLAPEVADAVTELIHFPEKVDLRPLIHHRGTSGTITMALELRRIGPFISASSRVRKMLEKYYPNRRIQQTFIRDEEIHMVATNRFVYDDQDL